MRRTSFAIALALAACTPETVERQVMVSTRLSVDSLTCGPATPDQLPLDCGGSIGFFAIDPYAAEGENILASHCVDFAPSAEDTLRMLATHLASASFSFAEGTTIALQVIVYPGTEEGCPPLVYQDGFWESTPGGQTPRYAGRSAAQTLQGEQVTFDLPIGCPVFFFPECPSSTHKLQSYVRNLSTLRLLNSGEAQAFDVHAAQIFYPGGDPVAAALTPIADLTPQTSSFDALFEVTSETGFGFTTDCIGTIVTRIPGPSVSTASCEGGIFSETQILAQSYYVEQPDIDDILAAPALGLTAFPAGGLLIGRLTQNGGDIGDAIFTVRPQSGTAEVHYFDEDATGHLIWRPTGGSWFVVTDATLEPFDQMGPARCCEYFEAVDERGDVFPSYARVGLINGVVTSTEIPTFTTGM